MSTTLSPAFVRFLAMAMATALDREQQRSRLLGVTRHTREPPAVPAPVTAVPPASARPAIRPQPVILSQPAILPPPITSSQPAPVAAAQPVVAPPAVAPPAVAPPVVAPPSVLPVAGVASLAPDGLVGASVLSPEGWAWAGTLAPEGLETSWPDLSAHLLAEAQLREALARIIRDDALRHGITLKEW